MARLEDLKRGATVRGVLPNALVTVVDAKWHGSSVVELTYKDPEGRLGNELLYRDREPTLEIATAGRPWSFDADGAMLRLVSEAYRIRLAYLFDPLLAVHTSMVEPLPHQITAVYGDLLPLQPLRFLLADDPGAGKTIMAGLLIKELVLRGDLHRCLIVCPGMLVEQWQDELDQRFQLPFEILTNDKLEAARTGNWFAENPFAICRLDKLSRDETLHPKLELVDWDLIVVDEAHKMSASFFSGEVKETLRYKLGQRLSRITRHFLLMTATPHNGKEEDFQLFMALLDGDRFEGRFRDGVHAADTTGLMHRVVKEQLLRFDGTPLFPERIANTVNYRLSEAEAHLYKHVTDYVREEFNRADALENEGRKGTVGFALTILQRRLASSPLAISESLRRRRERLESRVREERLLQRGGGVRLDAAPALPSLSPDQIEELDDAPDVEVEQVENEIVDQATAARTIAELEAEIATLRRLEGVAQHVLRSGKDRKWEELSNLLQNNPEMQDAAGHSRKIVIFTEHRDTLNYLNDRIRTLIGRPEAVVTIHGGMGREERTKAQHAFTQDKEVQVLTATDAAGEGINLQRAHLMVNYDLPWNPNRLEQRFGRIHRIGQTEVCHLWNLVADETREGDVWQTLFHKIEEERKALGGGVFDILGKLFRDQPLRQLLVEAIRYGDRADVRARLVQKVNNLADRDRCRELLDERALARDSMDVTRVRQIREDMERAEARRLQPHYVEGFFLEAFGQLGGTSHKREPRRYEVSHVPALVRTRDRAIGRGAPLLPKYERITFEKGEITVAGKPLAAFVCPGHPLLDATIDLTLERHRDLLKRGAILVAPNDPAEEVRALLYLEHGIQVARLDRAGNRREVSRRLQFVEARIRPPSGDGASARLEGFVAAGYAPYLDYRATTDEERALLRPFLDAPGWNLDGMEEQAVGYAIERLVPEHVAEVTGRREEWVARTTAAVKERLTKEIAYWDHREQELKAQELAGKTPRLNSAKARQRADDLEARLQKRLKELEEERRISTLPPVVVGGALVVPGGLLARLRGGPVADASAEADVRASAEERTRMERLAVEAVLAAERRLGFDPKDRSADKCGYDVESRVPGTGRLRFLEVKGRVADARTLTVTRNEILTALNKPEDFILAIVLVNGEKTDTRYVFHPFQREPDFGAESVNYDLAELLGRAEEPR